MDPPVGLTAKDYWMMLMSKLTVAELALEYAWFRDIAKVPEFQRKNG